MNISVNRADVVWSYIGVLLSSSLNVIMLPIIIYYLDGDSLGLWYVFASIGSVTMLFDFGFSVTFARNITYGWSGATELKSKGTTNAVNNKVDFKLIRDILYTCKRVYFLISIVAFFLMLTIGTLYIIKITSHLHNQVYICSWLIFATGVFLNLYYNYFDSFLRGVGAIKQANQSRVYGRLSQLFTTILFLVCGFGIIGLSVSFLVSGIVFRILGKFFFYKYHHIKEELLAIRDTIDPSVMKSMFKTIWYNAWRDGLVSFSAYLVGQASVILCSAYMTLTETGIYSIGLQIANAIGMLSTTLYATYQPALQSNWIKGNKEKVCQIMSLTLFVFILSFFVGSFLCVIVGLPLLRIIKPETTIGVTVMIGILFSQFVIRFRDCYTSYFSSTNRLVYMPSFMWSSVLCIIMSFLLLEFTKLSLWGLIISQIGSQFVYNIWYWPIKAHRELGLTWSSFIISIKTLTLRLNK